MSVPTYAWAQQQYRRRFWLIVGGLIAIAVIGLAIVVGIAAYSAVNSLKQNGPIAARYYLNIMGGDYATAYSYLDSNATINGQLVGDQQSFIRLAKAADAQYGTVHGVSLNTQNDGTNVTVTIDRGSRSYDVHLVLRQESGTWKIVSADGI